MQICGILIALNRQEKGNGEISAIQKNIRHIVAEMKKYQQQYGVNV